MSLAFLLLEVAGKGAWGVVQDVFEVVEHGYSPLKKVSMIAVRMSQGMA